jgi:hypothetical protein
MADPTTYALTGLDVEIRPGMVLPVPDDAAAAEARDRLSFMDLGIGGPSITSLGMLAEAVVFIAGVQGSGYPRPLLSTRVVLFTGSHGGGLVAGPSPDPRHGLPLQHLAVNAGAAIVTLEWQPAAAAIEYEDAITPEQMEAAMRAGFAEAERAADEGIELLVLAAGGAGASTAAAAVVAATTGSEATSLIGRVATPAGLYDDNAWMTRCLAVRDALHRVRDRDGDPRSVICTLGGADIAAATGLLLGAAYRRTPVMIDGPVGAAAALLANDFSAQARRWVLLPDSGRHMAVRIAAEALDLHPWLDLCLDLGEGAAALAALPMLQTALTLAGAGEPVDPTPPTRYDSTGNQVFVGVARPVEPSDDLADASTDDAEAATGAAVGVATVGATVDTPTAEASTVDDPDKDGDKPAKAARTAPTKGTPARTVTAPKESPVKEAKPPAQRPGRAGKEGDQSPTGSTPAVSGKTAGGQFPTRPVPAKAMGIGAGTDPAKVGPVPTPSAAGKAPGAASAAAKAPTAESPKVSAAKPADAAKTPDGAKAPDPGKSPATTDARATEAKTGGGAGSPAPRPEPPKADPVPAGTSAARVSAPATDSAKAPTAKPEPTTAVSDAKAEPSATKTDPGKSGSAKPEPPKTAPATADAAKADPAKTEPAKADAAKTAAPVADAAKADRAKTDAASGAAKADASSDAKPDATAPGAKSEPDANATSTSDGKDGKARGGAPSQADAPGAADTAADGKAGAARTREEKTVAVGAGTDDAGDTTAPRPRKRT